MSEPRVRVPSIRMGEMDTASEGRLHTLLGSCVGVALYDARQQVGGLAHVVLPDSKGPTESPGKYGNTAIPLLLEMLGKLATKKLRLSAKIAGGANMFSTTSTETIGKQNIDAIEKLLAQHRIPLLASHCGGTQGMRMTLDVATGRVSIEIVGQETLEI